MKRIVASILLLAAALFITKSFAGELNNFRGQTQLIQAEHRQKYTVASRPSNYVHLTSIKCPCDPDSNNPPLTLILIAAMSASLVMATFIYGSQFIATWVVG